MKLAFNKPQNNSHVDKAKSEGCRRVADWVEDALPEAEQDDTHVMVNQIECAEEGCPPVECVIALLRKKPAPKLIFKIFKPTAEVTKEEALEALSSALSKESAESQSHEHGHGEAASEGGGEKRKHDHDACEHGDCCEHGHAEAEHGHAEAEHGHGAA